MNGITMHTGWTCNFLSASIPITCQERGKNFLSGFVGWSCSLWKLESKFKFEIKILTWIPHKIPILSVFVCLVFFFVDTFITKNLKEIVILYPIFDFKVGSYIDCIYKCQFMEGGQWCLASPGGWVTHPKDQILNKK